MTQQEDTVQEPRDKALCNMAVRRHSVRWHSKKTQFRNPGTRLYAIQQWEDTVQDDRERRQSSICTSKSMAGRRIRKSHRKHRVQEDGQNTQCMKSERRPKESRLKEDIVQDGRVLKAQCEQTLIKHCARLHRKDVMQADLKKEEKRPSCHNVITVLTLILTAVFWPPLRTA